MEVILISVALNAVGAIIGGVVSIGANVYNSRKNRRKLEREIQDMKETINQSQTSRHLEIPNEPINEVNIPTPSENGYVQGFTFQNFTTY